MFPSVSWCWSISLIPFLHKLSSCFYNGWKRTRLIHTDKTLVLYYRDIRDDGSLSTYSLLLHSYSYSTLPVSFVVYLPVDFPIMCPSACSLWCSWRQWVWLCLFVWLSTPQTFGWVSARSWTNLSPLTSTSIPPRSTTPAGKKEFVGWIIDCWER